MLIAGELVHELLPLLRRFCIGPYSIALGGSHAKGTSDQLSDVDLYLFAPAVLPGTHRSELVAAVLGSRVEAVSSWGIDEPFEQGGTDFQFRGRKVECWLRNSAQVAEQVAAAQRGRIRREYSIWAVAGFFGHVILADVHSMHIIEDPQSVLTGWKAASAMYPEPLRHSLLKRFMREAAFWPDNFHYRSAVARGDSLYTSGIAQQVVHALVQVVFALNRTYFPGDKKLSETLERLPSKPDAFTARVQALLFPESDPVPLCWRISAAHSD